MAYVCEQLGPNPETGHTECVQWVVNQSSSILPTLTTADRDEILIYMVSIFAVVFLVRMIRKLLGI